jgi:hypothetical protein
MICFMILLHKLDRWISLNERFSDLNVSLERGWVVVDTWHGVDLGGFSVINLVNHLLTRNSS